MASTIYQIQKQNKFPSGYYLLLNQKLGIQAKTQKTLKNRKII